MNILDKILQQKEKEVLRLREHGFMDMGPINGPATNQFQNSHTKTSKNKQIPKITHTFRNTKRMNIIAEIKRSSPSKGAIDMGINPVEQAKKYEKFGAGAISVLTDETFFNGSMDDLRAVRNAVELPLLCKDFMIDPIQIAQAKSAGATIILLIVAALTEEKLQELYTYAHEEDLEVLCEVHNEQEMDTALSLGAKVIGINNRNLKTFDVDLHVTERLAAMVNDPETILISESGIKLQEDVTFVASQGACGILVGETLMRANDLRGAFENLRVPSPTILKR